MVHDRNSYPSIGKFLVRPLVGLTLLLGGCQSSGVVGTLYQARGVPAEEPIPVQSTVLPFEEPASSSPSPLAVSLLPPLEGDPQPILPLVTPVKAAAAPVPEPGKFQSSWKDDTLLGGLTAKVTVADANSHDRWQDPLFKRTWQTEEDWRYTLQGPIFVFGQVNAKGAEEGTTDLSMGGRTGLACKLPVVGGGEVTVRGGPGVSYTDPTRPMYMRSQSDVKLELTARYPLFAGVGVEYEGAATPALTPLERDRLNQDLRLAFPVGESGKVQLGAKHRWEGTPDQRQGTEATELYLGFKLTR